jgi:hypothetical protein
VRSDSPRHALITTPAQRVRPSDGCLAYPSCACESCCCACKCPHNHARPGGRCVAGVLRGSPSRATRRVKASEASEGARTAITASRAAARASHTVARLSESRHEASGVCGRCAARGSQCVAGVLRGSPRRATRRVKASALLSQRVTLLRVQVTLLRGSPSHATRRVKAPEASEGARGEWRRPRRVKAPEASGGASPRHALITTPRQAGQTVGCPRSRLAQRISPSDGCLAHRAA